MKVHVLVEAEVHSGDVLALREGFDEIRDVFEDVKGFHWDELYVCGPRAFILSEWKSNESFDEWENSSCHLHVGDALRGLWLPTGRHVLDGRRRMKPRFQNVLRGVAAAGLSSGAFFGLFAESDFETPYELGAVRKAS